MDLMDSLTGLALVGAFFSSAKSLGCFGIGNTEN